jgi:hypothetical protein
MIQIQYARELVRKNQKAVVIFTHGDDFKYDSFVVGTTGKWVVSPTSLQKVDKSLSIFVRKGIGLAAFL